MSLRLAVTVFGVAAWAVACAAACDHGGSAGPFTPDATPDASADVSETVDAGEEGGIVYPVFSLDAGSTWSDLYRDYFGTTGVASCAGDGNCHGSTASPGYGRSGYLCPPKDKKGCYAGLLLSEDAGGAGLISPGMSFENDYLSEVLRQEDGGGGEMPEAPPYTFTHIDIERISAWIEAGAPNN